MNEQIKICHNLLNDVYENCEKFYSKINKLYKNVKMDSYKGHYIRINGKYEEQKYYMPVISIDDIGDICFNLDGISLEFFLDKNNLLKNCDFNLLLNTNYDVEIYDANDSTIDIYKKGMSLDLFIEKLEQWKSNVIGITINCQDKATEDIINIFGSISIILRTVK